MIFRGIFAYFENWIRPFERRDDLQPPRKLAAFVWFYVRQAPMPFVAMLAQSRRQPSGSSGASSTFSTRWSGRTAGRA